MNIILKLCLITIISSLLTLLVFDYQNNHFQLDLQKNQNCINLSSNNNNNNNNINNNNYICSNCFKSTLKNEYKQRLLFQSDQNYMILGLKQKMENMFKCEQLLQAMDYQKDINENENNQMRTIRFQSYFFQWLATHEQNNMRILFPDQTITEQNKKIKILQKISQYTSYATFYYSSDQHKSPLRIFYQNQHNIKTGHHLIKLFTISSILTLIFYIHFSQAESTLKKKYQKNILSVIGIGFAFIFQVFGNILEYQEIYNILIKIFLLTIVLEKTFHAAKFIFLGLNSIVFITVVLNSQYTALLTIIIETMYLIIIWSRIYSDSKDKERQSLGNQRLYAVIVLTVIVIFNFIENLSKEGILNEIVQFLGLFLSHFIMIVAVKRMDSNQYKKTYHSENTQQNNQFEQNQLSQIQLK